MAEDKVMACAGFTIKNEKDCVALGGKWKSDKKACVGFTINEKDCVALGGRWMDENDILLVGIGASKGKVIATCRIVDGDKERMAKLAPGEIMVTERTVPDDMIYMKKAAAFITNVGGLTSHTGVVAREWGIPAVVGTVEATTKLKDGQKVFLDGEKGIVLNVVPGIEAELEEKTKPIAAPSLAERMAAIAAKKGIDVPPTVWENIRRRERQEG